MNYHQFKRFMWFPLLRRFLWSWSAFKYAWKNIHSENYWTGGYYPWLRDNLEFKVGDFDYINGRKSTPKNVLPNGIEPFMLKKRCKDKDGNVRYFSVVPDGYSLVDINDIRCECPQTARERMPQLHELPDYDMRDSTIIHSPYEIPAESRRFPWAFASEPIYAGYWGA